MIFLGRALIEKYESEIAYLRDRIRSLEARELRMIDAALKSNGVRPVSEAPATKDTPAPEQPTAVDDFDIEAVFRSDFILEAQGEGLSLDEALKLWEAKKQGRWTPPGQVGT